jgi:uncharacterized protein YbjT (DUF2867 family)
MHLIVGASGTLGSRITRRLLARGDVVRAVSRDVSRLAGLRELGAVPIPGDLRSVDWMPAALEGVSSLILSSHGLVPPTRDNHPGVIDDVGNRRIIDAARQAGVQHIIMISAAPVAGGPTLFTTVKQRVEEHLQSSGTAYTVIQPTVFIETHAVLLIAEPLRDKGTVLFLGPGTATLNWISTDDVADHVVRASAAPPRNGIDVIGGSDNLSRREVLAVVEQLSGQVARRRHVPVSMLRVIGAAVGPFHPGMKYLLDMALAEATASGGAPAPALDWTGPTTVRDVIQRWVGGR